MNVNKIVLLNFLSPNIERSEIEILGDIGRRAEEEVFTIHKADLGTRIGGRAIFIPKILEKYHSSGSGSYFFFFSK